MRAPHRAAGVLYGAIFGRLLAPTAGQQDQATLLRRRVLQPWRGDGPMADAALRHALEGSRHFDAATIVQYFGWFNRTRLPNTE